MAKLTEKGTYLVAITDAVWKPCKNGMQAHLTGETSNGDYTVARLAATPTIIKSGRNKGKTLTEVTIATLKDLGLPCDAEGKPVPGRLPELKGRKAEFVCDYDTFEGEDGEEREFLTVKFINPAGGKPAASASEVNDFFGGLGFGTADAAGTGEVAADAGDNGDIPF